MENMNIICDRSELIDAIKRVSRVIPAKHTFHLLEGVLLSVENKVLKVSGYDLEIAITVHIDCENVNDNEFSVIANPRLLTNILKNLSKGRVNIIVDDNFNMSVVRHGRRYTLSCMSAEEYPELPVVQAHRMTVYRIAEGVLRDLLDKTLYALSTNDAKPIMTGALFDIDKEGLHVVALDGFRLAVATGEINHDDEGQFIVPGKMLREVLNNLDGLDHLYEWSIVVDDKRVLFSSGDCMIISRLLEGEFHRWRATIPPEFVTHIKIDTKDMIETVKAAKLLLNERNKSPLKLDINKDTLSVSVSTGIGSFSDVLSINNIWNNGRLHIGMNTRYFEDAIKHIKSDTIYMKFNGCNKAILIEDEGENAIHIVMPLKLKENENGK